MPRIPGNVSVTLTPLKIRLSDLGVEADASAILESANTDANNTPTWRFREGNVVVKRTSTGQYVEANDSNGDRNTQAYVLSIEDVDSDWASSTITVKVNGFQITAVALASTDDTAAEVAAALNADTDFAAHCNAEVSGSKVNIETLHGGADMHIEVTSDLATAFGTTLNKGYGTDADYRVTLQAVDLKDESDTAIAGHVRTARIGHFDESNLINLTAEARVVLSRRGSIFD